ncbi:DUF5959 family protein [Streptomyces sp. NPDC046332]|uniref:DUF5959 family protein n=1 Tax=Streptomyces sp. NPDC046332 TaxID=3155133 RepID=UPI0033E82F5A
MSGRSFDAEIQIRSDFVNASVRTGIFDQDIEEWGLLLDALEEVMDDASEDDDEEVFSGDWPTEGRTAYLRFVADDPLVIEVRDAPGQSPAQDSPRSARSLEAPHGVGQLAQSPAYMGDDGRDPTDINDGG